MFFQQPTTKKSAVGKFKVPVTKGVIGWTVQKEELINLADAREHPQFFTSPLLMEDEYRAILSVPIIHRKQVLGVLAIQQSTARQFNEEEEAFLVTLSAQVAVTINGLKQKKRVQVARKQILLEGESAAPGIAIANALVIGGQITLEQPEVPCLDVELEYQRLCSAITRTRASLDEITQKFNSEQHEELASIFSALHLLLDETSLGGEYEKEVMLGWGAESAVSRVSLRYIQQFLGDG